MEGQNNHKSKQINMLSIINNFNQNLRGLRLFITHVAPAAVSIEKDYQDQLEKLRADTFNYLKGREYNKSLSDDQLTDSADNLMKIFEDSGRFNYHITPMTAILYKGLFLMLISHFECFISDRGFVNRCVNVTSGNGEHLLFFQLLQTQVKARR